MLVSVERILQQEASRVAMDEPHSCIICRQQSAGWVGARHANPGSAADSSTIANINQAYFLSTSTV